MHCLGCVHLLGFFWSGGFYPLFFFFFAVIVFVKNPDHLSYEISHILGFADCIAMFLFIMFFWLLWFLQTFSYPYGSLIYTTTQQA